MQAKGLALNEEHITIIFDFWHPASCKMNRIFNNPAVGKVCLSQYLSGPQIYYKSPPEPVPVQAVCFAAIVKVAHYAQLSRTARSKSPWECDNGPGKSSALSQQKG